MIPVELRRVGFEHRAAAGFQKPGQKEGALGAVGQEVCGVRGVELDAVLPVVRGRRRQRHAAERRVGAVGVGPRPDTAHLSLRRVRRQRGQKPPVAADVDLVGEEEACCYRGGGVRKSCLLRPP